MLAVNLRKAYGIDEILRWGHSWTEVTVQDKIILMSPAHPNQPKATGSSKKELSNINQVRPR